MTTQLNCHVQITGLELIASENFTSKAVRTPLAAAVVVPEKEPLAPHGGGCASSSACPGTMQRAS